MTSYCNWKERIKKGWNKNLLEVYNNNNKPTDKITWAILVQSYVWMHSACGRIYLNINYFCIRCGGKLMLTISYDLNIMLILILFSVWLQTHCISFESLLPIEFTIVVTSLTRQTLNRGIMYSFGSDWVSVEPFEICSKSRKIWV